MSEDCEERLLQALHGYEEALYMTTTAGEYVALSQDALSRSGYDGSSATHARG